MSEPSVKSSNKKGFKAPVLKVLDNAVKSNKDDPLEVKASKIQKQESKPDGKENKQEDGGFSQKIKKEKKINDNKIKQLDGINPSKKEKKTKMTHEKKEESSGDRPSPKKVKKLKKKFEDNNESVVGETSTQKEKKIKKKNKETEESGKSKTSPKKEKFKKPEVSLTDSQYEDIFKSVLKDPNSQYNTPIEELLEAVASSSEKSSVKGCQTIHLTESEGSVKTSVSLKEKNLTLAELSPWGSHLSKQNSQASSILKELQASQASSLLSPEPTSSSEDTDGDADVVLSQRSVRQLSQRSYTDIRPVPTSMPRRHKVDKRPVLEDLQTKRNVGLWVFCDRMTCQKQRYLPHVTDPQELPDVWYCHMNPDPRYNSCSCEEQQPSPEEEKDMIDNQFTCGSVVWARVTGFPWWPAMVDDDPDLECYYWLLEDMRTVTFYHVVFFDKNEVTRAWIPIKNVLSYKRNINTFKQRVVRGIDFTPRLRVAREHADEAVSMTVPQRLQKYSFIARYKGPIFDDQTQIEKTKKKYKLKCFIGKKEAGKRGQKRRANSDGENDTPFEAIVKTNKSIKDQKQRKISEEEIEKKSIGNKDASDSEENNKPSEVAGKPTYKESETTYFVPLSSQTNISAKSPGSKLDFVEKQNTSLNSGTYMVGKGSITQSRENCDASETPSVLDGFNNLKSTKETAQNLLEEMGSKTPSVVGCNLSQKSKTSSHKSVRIEEMGSKTPSVIGCNLSQKSKTSSHKSVRVTERGLEDSFGSVVEPSQALDRPRVEEEDSQHNKLSQSTIAEFLAAESEDAVVPEGDFSQQSEPFEE